MATPEQTVQMALIALTEADFIGVVERFNEQFTFIDHAIELEFKDKRQLIDFLALNRELLSNSKRVDSIICSSGNKVVSEWALTGTTREHYFGHMMEVPFRGIGVSIVQVDNGKISRWSEYYDQTVSRRYRVAAYLKEWTELACVRQRLAPSAVRIMISRCGCKPRTKSRSAHSQRYDIVSKVS